MYLYFKFVLQVFRIFVNIELVILIFSYVIYNQNLIINFLYGAFEDLKILSLCFYLRDFSLCIFVCRGLFLNIFY